MRRANRQQRFESTNADRDKVNADEKDKTDHGENLPWDRADQEHSRQRPQCGAIDIDRSDLPRLAFAEADAADETVNYGCHDVDVEQACRRQKRQENGCCETIGRR